MLPPSIPLRGLVPARVSCFLFQYLSAGVTCAGYSGKYPREGILSLALGYPSSHPPARVGFFRASPIPGSGTCQLDFEDVGYSFRSFTLLRGSCRARWMPSHIHPYPLPTPCRLHASGTCPRGIGDVRSTKCGWMRFFVSGHLILRRPSVWTWM